MEISQFALISLLFFSAVWGCVIALTDNANKAIRIFLGVNNVPKSNIKRYVINCFVFVQDFLFTLLAVVGLILLNYYFNNGVIRFFSLLAFAIGFSIFYFLFGKLLMFIITPITLFLRKLFFGTLRYLCDIFSIMIKKIFYAIKKGIAKKQNIKYNKKRRARLLELSECGFLES